MSVTILNKVVFLCMKAVAYVSLQSLCTQCVIAQNVSHNSEQSCLPLYESGCLCQSVVIVYTVYDLSLIHIQMCIRDRVWSEHLENKTLQTGILDKVTLLLYIDICVHFLSALIILKFFEDKQYFHVQVLQGGSKTKKEHCLNSVYIGNFPL